MVGTVCNFQGPAQLGGGTRRWGFCIQAWLLHSPIESGLSHSALPRRELPAAPGQVRPTWQPLAASTSGLFRPASILQHGRSDVGRHNTKLGAKERCCLQCNTIP
jgi:glycine/D-amino acid oxidase-like deaminating enzyme